MGIIAAKSRAKSSENWGMGLFLIFFYEDNKSTAAAATSAIVDTSAHSSQSTVRGFGSNNNAILTRTQSTISICALLLLLTLLLFTFSTFEPASENPRFLNYNPSSRRFLSEKYNKTPKPRPTFSFFAKPPRNSDNHNKRSELSFALQGMGKLYRRGTRAMSDLVVGHVLEDTTEDEFKVFLRVLHRSGITARADVAFLFGSSPLASKFESLIREENESFSKLVHFYNFYRGLNSSNGTRGDSAPSPSFDVTQFVKKHAKKEMREPLWGKKRIRVDNLSESGEPESTRLSYGSLVGFEASELDPENSLAGFLDHVPMSLRRWACYPMLLGRVRRNFKHVVLVDIKNLVLVKDPLGRVRNRRPESVHIPIKQESITPSKNTKRNSEKTQVNPGILMGGNRGIRRFSNAMLTEIVRAAMQRKKNRTVTESSIMTELAGNEHLLKNIDLTTSTESVQETSSLGGSISSLFGHHHGIIQRGNNNNNISNRDLNSIILKILCSCELDSSSSSVYRDC